MAVPNPQGPTNTDPTVTPSIPIEPDISQVNPNPVEPVSETPKSETVIEPEPVEVKIESPAEVAEPIEPTAPEIEATQVAPVSDPMTIKQKLESTLQVDQTVPANPLKESQEINMQPPKIEQHETAASSDLLQSLSTGAMQDQETQQPDTIETKETLKSSKGGSKLLPILILITAIIALVLLVYFFFM